jgi:arsenate reductase-like glutaredoxin family protein
MNTNRFKQLLESTMGNVKPLLSEQTTRDPKSYNIDRLEIIDDETTYIYLLKTQAVISEPILVGGF